MFSEQQEVHLEWRPLASEAFLGTHLESRSNLASSVSTANTRHDAMMEVLSFPVPRMEARHSAFSFQGEPHLMECQSQPRHMVKVRGK